MERKLLTKRGRSLYKKRGGQVKEGQGFPGCTVVAGRDNP